MTTVVITGANRGLGLALAQRYAVAFTELDTLGALADLKV